MHFTIKLCGAPAPDIAVDDFFAGVAFEEEQGVGPLFSLLLLLPLLSLYTLSGWILLRTLKLPAGTLSLALFVGAGGVAFLFVVFLFGGLAADENGRIAGMIPVIMLESAGMVSLIAGLLAVRLVFSRV